MHIVSGSLSAVPRMAPTMTDAASAASCRDAANISACAAVGFMCENARFTAPKLRVALTSAFASAACPDACRPAAAGLNSPDAETNICASHSFASTRSERARAPGFVGRTLSCCQYVVRPTTHKTGFGEEGYPVQEQRNQILPLQRHCRRWARAESPRALRSPLRDLRRGQ